MPDENQKRLHRCFFMGHRPEKLDASPEEVRAWLEKEIDRAIADGYTTFISGCAMGADIWAGQIVLRKKAENPALRLIAATPWPGFAARWTEEWKRQYDGLLKEADLVYTVSDHYSDDVFARRNRWMADHSRRLIAYFSGAPGGTKDTVEYAGARGLEVVVSTTGPRPKKARKAKEEEPPGPAYPENLLADIGFEALFGQDRFEGLSPDQAAGLDHAVGMLPEREQELLRLRYQEERTLQECGERFGFSRERARQILVRAVGKLRHPSRAAFIRDGYGKAELALMIKCAESIKKNLLSERKRRPMMTEEDTVKFAFQGMLGVGHMVPSEAAALERLRAEMSGLEADPDEKLTERLSPQWFRLNLRAAKAKGLKEEDIAYMLYRSAEKKPLDFTRRNVYNFCVKLDGSDRMKAAAQCVLDENRLPSHSDVYREAYSPAYRVLHMDFIRLRAKRNEDPENGNGTDDGEDGKEEKRK